MEKKGKPSKRETPEMLANESKKSRKVSKEKSMKESGSPFRMTPSPSALKCWKGYKRKPGTKEFSPGSCEKK